MSPEDPADWPRVVEWLSAILLASEKGREAEEREVWMRVVDGRPVYAWIAIAAFMRPGILAARADGYILNSSQVEALRQGNPALRFDVAPGAAWLSGVPIFQPDLFRPAASGSNALPSIPCDRHPGKSLADCGCPTAAEVMGVQPSDVPF